MKIDPLELSRKLKEPLPGATAQYLMAGLRRKQELIDIDSIQGYRESAVCLLLRTTSETTYFYLIERAVYEGVHSGQIALPGGKKDEIDNDHTETALRELFEETGLLLNKGNLLGGLSRLYIPPSNFMVYPFVAIVEYEPLFIADSREVQSVLEVDIRELLNEENIKETTLDINGLKIKTPYFDLRGKVVWGATAMILSEFRSVISSFQSL